MKYMGSKNRIAKHILPIILKDRKEGQWYVEPFVGGANLIDKVGGNRMGADNNVYLIALLNEMQKPDFYSPTVDEEEYNEVKNNPSLYPKWYVAFTGFQLSYGAMWFSSYRRDSQGVRDYADEAKRNIDKQSKKISDIIFLDKSYNDLEIPSNSIIYCDPPYENTASYKAVDTFNHEIFWEWCREKAKEGHTVFVSEYNAPNDFECVWEKEVNSSLTKNTGAKKATEKLFVCKQQKS